MIDPRIDAEQWILPLLEIERMLREREQFPHIDVHPSDDRPEIDGGSLNTFLYPPA